MKRRINELLKEKFTWEEQKLRLSVEEIREEVPEGRHFRGKFTVRSGCGELIQGFLYSTNPILT